MYEQTKVRKKKKEKKKKEVVYWALQFTGYYRLHKKDNIGLRKNTVPLQSKCLLNIWHDKQVLNLFTFGFFYFALFEYNIKFIKRHMIFLIL